MSVSVLLVSVVITAGASVDAGTPAPTRRALVVGINAYVEKAPRNIKPLSGAVPDAKNVAERLKALRFDDVRLLLDADATRAEIIAGIRALGSGARPGDVRVFYYSGHGSQAQNDQSTEADKLDEAIVPFDAPSGAFDLRDKELAREFNAVIDHGVVLTVILDSCHSGSGVRGELPPSARAKIAPRDLRVVSDPSRPVPPELRGALILSAAQDLEFAFEFATPTPHGAFTSALLAALDDRDAATEPTQRLFQRTVQQLLQANTKQTPVMAGTTQRQRATLFDAAPAVITQKTEVAVTTNNGRVVVEAGLALGLGVGSVLGKPDGHGGHAVKLKVTQVTGPAKAQAIVFEGDAAAVGAGGLFEVIEWAAAPTTQLQVDLGGPGSEPSTWSRCQSDLKALKAKPGVQLVNDPTRRTHWLEWDGTAWVLYGPTAEATTFSSKALRAWKPPAGAAIFAVMPPPRALVDALAARWSNPGGLVGPSSRAQAHYRLLGQLTPTGAQYGLVREPRLATGPLAALPEHTDLVSTAQGGVANAVTALNDAAARLALLSGWLLLKSPEQSDAKFPYQLVLKRADGTLRGDGDVVTAGETYSLALRADPSALGAVQQRWVYVFALDKDGTRQLLFPQGSRGNVENQFPTTTSAPAPEIMLVDSAFDISPPFGTDTYFLLATDSKLPDLTVLNAQGVTTRSTSSQQPLPDDLLMPVTQRTRGVRLPPQPTDWTVRRIVVRSAP